MSAQQKFIAFLLHFYQPPWQDEDTLRRIDAKCYRPLLETILANDCCHLTLNINYSLVELLQNHGLQKTVDLMARALSLPRCELTGTAAYHPILPLIPERERRRQTELNEKGIENAMDITPGPGFFPPEMAFSADILPAIRQTYEWTIANDTVFACPEFSGYAPCKSIPAVDGFPVIMRSSHWSDRLAFNNPPMSAQDFANDMRANLEAWFAQQDGIERSNNALRGQGYVVIALDAETFGHHRENYHQYLLALMQSMERAPDTKLATASELIDLFPQFPADIPACSWATGSHHIKSGAWYPLWNHPLNRCHQLLWRVIHRVWRALDEKDKTDRQLADKIINSCQFWWLSAEKWNPDNAFKTMPDIRAYFDHCFGGLTLEVKSYLEELESITKTKIL